MKMYKDRPIFMVNIPDENEGIYTISLVDKPAMELPMFCFSESKMKFSMEDEVKHNIISCIVRCDYPILRVTEDGNPFYIVFNRETSEKLCQKLMTNGHQQNISLDHNGKLIDGIQLQEVFIKDSSKGISPVGFEDAADGSLFGIYHIESEELWNDCVSGKFGGVSLESYCRLGEFSKITINKNKNNMSRIKDMLKNILMEFSKVATDKGELVWDEDGDLEVGTAVFVETDGERTPAEDGEYTTEDSVIKVEGGVVTAIEKKEAPAETPAEETETPAEEEKKEEMEEETETPAETPAEETETPAEEVKDEKDEKIAELEDRIAALEAKIEEITAKLVEIATTPAAEPIVEEFDKVTKTKTTGDKNLDKRIALAAALKDIRK